MSKSGLKNLNNLGIFKTPYIVFGNNTYKNLLFKLNKSSVWLLSKKKQTYRFLGIKKDDLYLKHFMYPVNKRKNVIKTGIIFYNPNTLYYTSKQIECFFFKKINNF